MPFVRFGVACIGSSFILNFIMSGVDPYSYMHQVSMRLRDLTDRDEIEETLDNLEYLFEVIPPEMQENAEQLISLLRERLKAAEQ